MAEHHEVQMCGGFGGAKQPDQEIQQLVNKHHDEILSKVGLASGQHIKVISYKSQVVAGTNYDVKVEIGSHHYTVRIFEGLPHTGGHTEVTSVEAA
jgi:hypothetical protein